MKDKIGPQIRVIISKFIFLISQPKHLLWVLKRTISLRSTFEHPKDMFKLIGKKNNYNTRKGAQDAHSPPTYALTVPTPIPLRPQKTKGVLDSELWHVTMHLRQSSGSQPCMVPIIQT